MNADIQEPLEITEDNQKDPTIISSTSIDITFLVVSGLRKTLTFQLTDRISSIKKFVFENWPKEFEIPPENLNQIRLLYLGKFLDDDTTLKDSKFSSNNTIIHLIVRPYTTFKEDKKKTEDAPKCTCIIL
ncbi:hypothetical protein BB559_003396 [Furculomyces boomerangus]|uniref:Ubiquitin-like domain-containing protein n=2 Tax=Harpellales TaxID=61421 RepID=A0A2T9YLG8_9FUNG|nr:hypothetical protein BB559_003396 [Furculomyces boomerangus]PWA03184.1 hypothetical protein BB558_000653 [Smittium angustum]